MPEKACISCKHATFPSPPDWKPGYEGDKFRLFEVAKIIKETERWYQGKCTFNPEWVNVYSGHYCGRWEKNIDYRDWPDDHADFVWGPPHIQRQRRIEEENKALKQQLKRSREISASRLARLKTLNGGGG